MLIFLIEEFRIFDNFSEFVNYSNFGNWLVFQIGNFLN